MTHSRLVPRLALCLMWLVVGCSAANPPAAMGGAGAVHSVEGAWRLIETAVREPARDWEPRPTPQGGLFVFTERHYSFFYVRGASPRPRFADANQATTQEKAQAYDTFIAGAGRYTRAGDALELTTDFMKNPNEMTGEVWRWEMEASGDTLRFVFRNPPYLPGRDWRWTVVRVE